MGSTEAGTVDRKRSDQGKTRVDLAFLLYQQIAAVLSAFSLMVFLRHFVEVPLSSAMLDIFDFWDKTIRSTTVWILDHSIVPLFDAVFQTKITVPVVIQDYLSIGVILYASFQRARFRLKDEAPIYVKINRPDGSSYPNAIDLILEFIGFLLIWPQVCVQMVRDMFYVPNELRLARLETQLSVSRDELLAYYRRVRPLMRLVVLAPLVYLALLFAINSIFS